MFKNSKAIAKIDKETSFLFSLGLGFPFNSSELSKLNQTRLFALITKKHRCYHHIYEKINDFEWKDEFRIKLKKAQLRQKQASLLQLSVLIELNQILKDFDFIVLKGLALSQELYGDYSFRSSSDIDILIPARDEKKIAELLKTKAYQYYKNNEHHLVLKRQGISIEIHRKLTAVFDTKHLEAKIWPQTHNIIIESHSFRVLDPQSQFLFLLINGSIHQWSRLSWVLDFINYRKTHKNLSQDHEFKHLEQLFDSIFLSGQTKTTIQKTIIQALSKPIKRDFISQYHKANYFAKVSNYSKFRSYFKSLIRLLKRV